MEKKAAGVLTKLIHLLPQGQKVVFTHNDFQKHFKLVYLKKNTAPPVIEISTFYVEKVKCLL